MKTIEHCRTGCSVCNQTDCVTTEILLFGLQYHSYTLAPTQLIETHNSKTLLICRICLQRVELFHKITHQKYSLFKACSQRVSEQSTTNSNCPKGSTQILNELLADDVWLRQLFDSIRQQWADADLYERRLVK